MKRTNRLEKPRRQNWCRYSAHDSAVCPRNKLNSIIAMQCIRKPVVRIQCRWAYSYGTCKCAILSHTIHVYSRIIYETCAGTYAAYKLWGVESKWVLLHSAFGVLTSAHWKDKKKKSEIYVLVNHILILKAMRFTYIYNLISTITSMANFKTPCIYKRLITN